jgi:hypothetical protein
VDWEKLPKPWSREQCKERFVKGDRISIRQMTAASGKSKSTIERWRVEDRWEDERGRYQDELKTVTREKTIEKASDKLSDELADIATANFKAHKLVRDYAHLIFQIKARHLKEIQQLPPEEQVAELKKHSASEMNYWSLILSRSTQEIAAATGLPYYINVNTSAKKLEQEGYVVLDPRSEESNDERP